MPSFTLATLRHELHELAFRTLFRASAAGGDTVQRVVYRAYFGWLYRKEDPWRYSSNAYELDKYERTLAVIGDRPVASALEAGCGEGHFSAMLLDRGVIRSLTGVDVNEQALIRARRRCLPYGNARFVSENVATTVPHGPFDLIVCAELLYYLGGRATHAATLLAEQLAVGGRLVAVHPSDRVDALHATWLKDSSLQLIGSEQVADDERPYRIDVFERAGRRDQD